MNDLIIVYYLGKPFKLYKIVAERYYIRDAETINSEDLFWKVLRANVEYGKVVADASADIYKNKS